MSGHSKWATIHRAKEAKDSKRAAAFTKLAQAITIAVRQGGGIGDPDQNFKLRLAVDKARAANMPKENIERAIERATGANGANLEEAMYEGFLPGGVAVMVQTYTDNRLRTQQAIRDVIDKNGGNLGSVGAVGYLFSQLGEIVLKNGEELEIIDAGAEDMEKMEEGWLVWVTKDRLFEVKENLEKKGFTVESAELVMKPLNYVEVSDSETRERVEQILEKLEDLDDVQKVFTNYS